MINPVRETLTRIFDSQLNSSLSLASTLKSAASSFNLIFGEQIHTFAIKSGDLHSIFVKNALIHLYARCGHLPFARKVFLSSPLLNSASWNILLAAHLRCTRPDLHLHDARSLFDEMPQRDLISFTTMIMAFAKHGSADEALSLFRDMMFAGITPNEVALSSVISCCSRLGNVSVRIGRMVHGVGVKCGLDDFLLVATNLVHEYAVCFNFEDAEAVFGGMMEKNTVTWNVLLKGYAKGMLIEAAESVFERIPYKDVVSWGTMIDGYLRVDRLECALLTFCKMLKECNEGANEVMLVNLVSSCSVHAAISEGQQLHGVILKAGFDRHPFVQATLIHLYSECRRMDLAFLQFQGGSKENVSSWNAVIAGFMRNDDPILAQQLFDEMPERDVFSWSSMIAGYAQHGQHELALRLFRDMWKTGIQPSEITLLSVLSAIAGCSSLEEGKWVHDYINKNSVPLTDNLCASLIDMYAKCGSIHNAVQLFDYVRETYAGISSWNAIICGLAMHGHADASLSLFSDLLKTWIKPNSITFLGVLTACCHAGLVDVGRKYFESIESIYGLRPSIKHYGCMVDLLGRAGHLEEAEELIESMPMEADVVIWGSMLASARTHKKIGIGERAVEKLAKLDPRHGAGRVLMSNIYADAARWGEVCLVRREIWCGGLKKEVGQSSIL